MPLLSTSPLETRKPGHRPARRLITPLSLLPGLIILVGCASTSPAPAPVVDGDLTKAMFETAFEDINTVYITKPNMANLAMASLQQLTSLDPDVAAVQIGDQVNLDVRQEVVDSFAIKPDMKAGQWGKLVAKATAGAIDRSDKLQKLPIEKIYQAELTGVISKLDPFSRYDGPDQAAEKRASRDGFGGLGINISVEDGTVRIVSVIHYTPAERMGLKRDDLIQTIDGQSTKGLSQNDVVNLLRGPVGSQVTLNVSRVVESSADNEPAKAADQAPRQSFSVALVRAHVVPETVAAHREGDIAYIRIYSFNAGTEEGLKHAILDAQSEIGPRLAGYILDLRDNPGGLLNQSVAVSNLFLTGGRIVSTQGRHPDSHQFFEASGNDITDGKPIAVLIDGNSASAAEIVTAALQDNDRAAVIGSNSYGKGTVQTVLDMPNKGTVTLTWARYHAPSGYTLHHLGVLPTICTVGKHSADAVMKDLALGRLPAIPTDKRNATSPDDTAGLDALRKTCPARTEDDPIDLEVAKRLLHQPNLFAEAVHLAQPPATANSDQSSSLDLLPALLN
jgi:carboxyl-terminal processing protease